MTIGDKNAFNVRFLDVTIDKNNKVAEYPGENHGELFKPIYLIQHQLIYLTSIILFT